MANWISTTARWRGRQHVCKNEAFVSTIAQRRHAEYRVYVSADRLVAQLQVTPILRRHADFGGCRPQRAGQGAWCLALMRRRFSVGADQ